MNDTNKTSNLTNPDIWIRLIYMIVFGFLSGLARLLVLILAAIQFVLVLVAGEENKNLRALGYGLGKWTEQVFLFLCFASDRKPYPFQDWPLEPQDVEEGESPSTKDGISSAGAQSGNSTDEASQNHTPKDSDARNSDTDTRDH